MGLKNGELTKELDCSGYGVDPPNKSEVKSDGQSSAHTTALDLLDV